MHVVLGATGHIGSALTQALLDKGDPVTAVVRDEAKRRRWEERGARVSVVDLGVLFELEQALRRLGPRSAPHSTGGGRA